MSDENGNLTIWGKTFSRRAFLKGGAAALALGAVGGGMRACATPDEVYTADYPVVPENKAELPKNGKSVLILGGGFGGMHAACELLDRGFSVTVIEKSNLLGGKLKSWRDTRFGVPPVNDPNWRGYPRDHGAHAVWGFYNNLREFMGRHGYKLWRVPRETSMYNYLDKDGTNAVLGMPPKWPAPLDRLELMVEARRIFAHLIGKKSLESTTFLRKMIAFDFQNVRQRLYMDSVSFPHWARSVGMPDELVSRFFGPLSEMAMFDNIDNASALYTVMLMSLATGSHDDMNIDVFMHPPGETYCLPIERYIKARGGAIVFDTPVIKLVKDGGRIKSVIAGNEGYVPGVKTWKCSVCGSVFASPTKPLRCPVCGAPAEQINPLASGPPKEYKADYYVVAMDTPGARELVAKSGLLGSTYFDNMQKLESVSVYPVNLWYDKCRAWEERFPGFIDFFPSGFKYLGITLNWASDGVINGKKVASPLVPDYAGRGINVIETQIADAARVKNFSDEEIAALVHEELKMVMPNLPKPTDFYVNRWENYSPQRVGYEAIRPPIPSPLDNLFFIGDWVRTDHESVYMEKTCVSAKMVTNHILERAGQKEGKITILKSGTPNPLINIVRTLYSVYP